MTPEFHDNPALIPVLGRCSVYEARPKLCRRFEPGTDSLCAEHTPDIAAMWDYDDYKRPEPKGDPVGVGVAE